MQLARAAGTRDVIGKAASLTSAKVPRFRFGEGQNHPKDSRKETRSWTAHAAAAAAAARLDSTRLDVRIKSQKHDCNGGYTFFSLFRYLQANNLLASKFCK